jgi:hypothetical protein
MHQQQNNEATSPAVALFQKVHGKMVMLQRLDAQLAGLIEQRRKVQAEISGLQGQINEEIDRQLRQADELPARILGEIADTARPAAASVGHTPINYTGPRIADVERSEAVAAAGESPLLH